MTALVGKPQYIYQSSPSNSTLTEYVYAYHGFTLLFNGTSLDRLIFFPPQTLKEYQTQYKDLDQESRVEQSKAKQSKAEQKNNLFEQLLNPFYMVDLHQHQA